MTQDEAWRTLKTSPPLSEAALKTAYRNLAKQFHPDRFASFDRKIWAAEKFMRVKEAYELLRRTHRQTDNETDKENPPPHQQNEKRSRATVFDYYPDQSELTGRDFIAWLMLWRLGVALGRMVTRSGAGDDLVESTPFRTAIGCWFLLLFGVTGLILFPVLALLGFSFAIYLLLQKMLFASIERLSGTRIGPDCPSLKGQVIYLVLLGLSAGVAIPFARYTVSFRENHDWITISLVWAFAGTLALTFLIETMLFLRSYRLRRQIGADLDSALLLPSGE